MTVTVFAYYGLWSTHSYYFPSNLLVKLLCVDIYQHRFQNRSGWAELKNSGL